MPTHTQERSQTSLKSISKQLDGEERLVSYRVHSLKASTVNSEGDLQTLLEMLMMQVAKSADTLGKGLDDSHVRFLCIRSGYYTAFLYQNSELRIGAIAEESMTLEQFKRLVA